MAIGERHPIDPCPAEVLDADAVGRTLYRLPGPLREGAQASRSSRALQGLMMHSEIMSDDGVTIPRPGT